MSTPLQVYVPVRLAITQSEVEEVRAGAFATRQEALDVLEHWRRTGHTAPMAVQSMPVWGSAAEWMATEGTTASGEPDLGEPDVELPPAALA